MDNLIMLGHGGGGRLTSDLVCDLFLKNFRNSHLEPLNDCALLTVDHKNLSFTTDSYVVSPLFFPGGNIGSLAVHGTVNDLAMSGARPLYLSAGYIIEEGFGLADLEKIVISMAAAAQSAGVQIVTGDTKVVPRGMADGVYINTAGIGVHEKAPLGPQRIKKDDVIIVNGTIGDHGAAVITSREEGFSENNIISDAAALNHLVQKLQKNSVNIHCLRDATRGGAGGVLAELAEQSRTHLQIEEKSLPVQEEVRGFAEIFGLEPLFLANEGKMLLFCPADEAKKVLEIMQDDPLGKNAAIIGRVSEENQPTGRVTMKTLIGGERIIDQPSGDLVPRIC
ncbi:MAG: hydrogenase expression/formation protein HypE [Pseudomonadota bacterium]|nr:hydrogenase expression/formation protein HypE [Pseudomonadota bacterium]